jgi:tRNA-splicing ligase RtcB
VRLQSLPALERMAVMPDVHPSADVCVGCVLGTAGVVYPQAIGGDIGCGMTTVPLEGAEGADTESLRALLREFTRSIDPVVRSSRREREFDAPPRLAAPEAARLHDPRLAKLASGEGLAQLGTLGRGNHFVEVQRDEHGRLWIMVHSGSRFMGQGVARQYTAIAQREGVKAALLGLAIDSPAGASYLADQSWCVEYARANRMLLLAAAAGAARRVLGARAEWGSAVDVPHNFVRAEVHGGRELLVHRKGAAPALAGQAGLIPGSAGTMSVHVQGRGEASSLASSSHGAGRLFSRSDARALVSERDVREQMQRVAYDERKERSLRDEAPGVYRDLRGVLEAQRDLIKVTRMLEPVVSFKAGG